jgi:hypothetical protein
MDDTQFWMLIARIDQGALDDGDEEGAVDPLVAALAALPPREIEGFAELLARALHAIDGRAYADAAGAAGQSGDGFLYARCYVVARGRDFYEGVIADPLRMPGSIDQWCEALPEAAASA